MTADPTTRARETADAMVAAERLLALVPEQPTRPACWCCGRQVAPLDVQGRCGHCGANRYNGTHDGERPCQLIGTTAPYLTTPETNATEGGERS